MKTKIPEEMVGIDARQQTRQETGSESVDLSDPTGQFRHLEVPEGTPVPVMRVLHVLQKEVFAPMKRRNLYNANRLALAHKLVVAAGVSKGMNFDSKEGDRLEHDPGPLMPKPGPPVPDEEPATTPSEIPDSAVLGD